MNRILSQRMQQAFQNEQIAKSPIVSINVEKPEKNGNIKSVQKDSLTDAIAKRYLDRVSISYIFMLHTCIYLIIKRLFCNKISLYIKPT